MQTFLSWQEPLSVSEWKTNEIGKAIGRSIRLFALLFFVLVLPATVAAIRLNHLTDPAGFIVLIFFSSLMILAMIIWIGNRARNTKRVYALTDAGIQLTSQTYYWRWVRDIRIIDHTLVAGVRCLHVRMRCDLWWFIHQKYPCVLYLPFDSSQVNEQELQSLFNLHLGQRNGQMD